MNEVLFQIVAIVALGMVAQWVAWRVRLPSILLLLGCGLIAGPITGYLKPDELFGELLLPIVSLSVSIILFEGGLSLRLRELGTARGAVFRLSTIGSLITWLLGAWAARWILGLPTAIALVMGALFVVTGPTVVAPMLRHLRPRGSVGNVLKWEGITTDPIGAILAVLLLEIFVVSHTPDVTASVSWAIGRAVILAGGAGVLCGWALRELLRRHILPDWLQGPWALMMVFGVYYIGNLIQHEAGLLSVTAMGALLANQRAARVARIAEFKENLQILLISALFIILAARVSPEQLMAIGWREFAFVGALVLAVRPITVMFSTIGSRLAWRERWLVAAMAPRGIVSAAMASVIALEMGQHDIPASERIVPVAFSVIFLTVVIYGIGSPIVARRLGLSNADPQGVLILGAQPWARAIAKALAELDIRVVLVDSNRRNVLQARLDGIATVHGNILAEHFAEGLDLAGIGRFLALTPNDEVNTLACEHLSEIFGSGNVYQLEVDTADISGVGGRRLFGEGIHYGELSQLFGRGAVTKATRLSDSFDLENYRELYGEEAVPLFIVSGKGRVQVLVRDVEYKAEDGHKLLGFVIPREEAPDSGREAAAPVVEPSEG